MYFAPSSSSVYVLWHMFGSFVLLRGLEAVVATAAAEEIGDPFIVPFEAVVEFVDGSVAATETGAVGDMSVCVLGVPESSESSAERSSGALFVSIYYEMRAVTDSVNGQIPDCRGLSEAAKTNPRDDKTMYAQKSMASQLARPIQFLRPSMMLRTDSW